MKDEPIDKKHASIPYWDLIRQRLSSSSSVDEGFTPIVETGAAASVSEENIRRIVRDEIKRILGGNERNG